MILKRILISAGIALALASSGCTSLSTPGQSSTPPTAKAPENSETPPTRPFERDTLYELLLAEFAGKRNRADVALGKYLKQAHETRDPQVVERAAFIARYLGAHQATLDASKLWLEIDPNNPIPRELAATELIRFGKIDEAMAQIDLLLANEGSLNFEFLLKATRSANMETRQQVLDKLREYSKTHNDAKLWFAKGSLENMNGQHKTAINDYENALELEPGYGNAILGKSQALNALGETEAAMAFLAEQTSLWPDNKRLGVTYARFLMQQNQLEAAQQQFYRLSTHFPHDGDLVLSLALLSWENQKRDEAKSHFQKLLQMNHRTDEANLYLARIAITEKDYDRAGVHFQQVQPGRHYPAAQIQLALMLQETGNIEKALTSLDAASQAMPKEELKFTLAKSEVLSKAGDLKGAVAALNAGLESKPDDTSILYSRAMLREQLDDFGGMEEDLRKVLELQPNNSAALNALGYTFADRNQRLSEAWELIEKAYTLNPKDPAIIDSMGWIKYRMGDMSSALDYLRQAYEAFADQEIAAHLGEVLWVTGEQEEAQSIWKDALDKNPDSKILKEVMDRFLPSL
ncbi:MAG: tetratricopeptide repeat protein [Pseudomonadales bacterium]|nr:tetratricopeptide repeat protein [Pseudomonadales bacterium]